LIFEASALGRLQSFKSIVSRSFVRPKISVLFIPLRLRLRTWVVFLAALMLTHVAGAMSLDRLFQNVRTCSFNRFFYSPWAADESHEYFLNRKPIDESKSDSYVFKVTDTLFGLPVVEVRVPGTWDFHAVTFDVPLKESRKVLLKKFGSTFQPSKASLDGTRPALVASATNPKQSILYCNEQEGE
jgi:hypothetical protein